MGLFGTTVKDIRKWESEKKVDKIAKALNKKDIEVRKAAITAFGNLRVVNGASLLIPNLNSDDYTIRKLTENAIVKIGYVAVDDLRKAKRQIDEMKYKSLMANVGKHIFGYTDAQIDINREKIDAVIYKYNNDK